MAADSDDAYEISVDESAEIPAEWQGSAQSGAASVYELESPARCPHCKNQIRTVHVLGLKRTKVSFTSTLPRGGRALVCPACESVLSVEL